MSAGRTVAPLSSSQRGLWLVEQLGESNSAYHLPLTLRLSGPVDEAALERAVRDLVQRHGSLRTVVGRDGIEPVSELRDASLVPFDVTVCDGDSVDAREADATARIRAFIDAPFDLTVDAPCRIRLLRVSATEHVLVLVVHHIASDGWSENIIGTELAHLYSAHAAGTPADLPALPLRYLDYAVWQHDNDDRADLERQLEQWRAHLTGLRPFELPTDFARPARRGGAGSGYHFLVEPGLAAAVRGLAVRCGVTPYMVFLSAYFVLLGRYADRSDVSLGASVATRDRSELAGLVGNFVNTVVLRGDLSGEPSFADLVSRVRDEVVGALGRQEVPFEQVVRELAPVRDLSRNPLYQLMFAYLPAPADPGEWTGLRVRRERTVASHSTFDLTLSLRVSPRSGALAGYIEYSTELFRPDTVRRLARHLNRILASAVDDPDVAISELELLPDSDRHEMVVDWNSDTEPLPAATLPDLIAAQDPAAPAVRCAGVELDYGALVREARGLAARLRDLGVGPESPVAICLPRGVDLIVAMTAVMMAGGCYLALDPDYPADRLAFMVDDAQPGVVIGRGALAFDAPGLFTVLDLSEPRPRVDPAAPLPARGPGPAGGARLHLRLDRHAEGGRDLAPQRARRGQRSRPVPGTAAEPAAAGVVRVRRVPVVRGLDAVYRRSARAADRAPRRGPGRAGRARRRPRGHAPRRSAAPSAGPARPGPRRHPPPARGRRHRR